MKKLAAILIAIVAMYFGFDEITSNRGQPANSESVTGSNAEIASAYANRRTDLQVAGQGTVTRILADDNDGDRHQRFVLDLGAGQTVLVAHNIDLADRLEDIGIGDAVSFFGEYEWNAQGGVIHWTHHDPAGRHVDGWLEHNGRRFQ